MDNCITCKKQNKGNNWRNCKLKCHYKYEQRKKDEIYKLQEENRQLQKRFNDYQDRKIEENANLIKRLDIADKKLTVFSRELEQANKENKRLRKINHELAEEHKTIGQDLYAEIKNYRKEKENLKEENARLRKFLNQYQEEANALKSYETYKVWLNNEYRKKIEKMEEIIKKLPDYYNSLDCEAKGHRAIIMVEEIRQIIADQKESEA